MRAQFLWGPGVVSVAGISIVHGSILLASGFGLIGGFCLGFDIFGTLLPIYTQFGRDEATPVRGLSETIREQAPRIGATAIVGGRASVSGRLAQLITVVEGVELQA